jgi:ABC-type glycerol-3-phosphate transport system permease component
MILLVKLADPQGPKRNWPTVLAFAVLAVGPYVVLFWILTRH